MTVRTYETPQAFKMAIETRLREKARASGIDMGRLRQLVVFDRYLARLFTVFRSAIVLKGGLALEFRLERARTTKDIDLRLMGDPDEALGRLQEAGRLDMKDFLQYEVQVDPENPELLADGLPYEGRRFRAEARLAGKIYGSPFGIDIAFAEPLVGEPETVSGDAFLDFIGVEALTYRVYPVETHIAEKIHAYTMPRRSPNSRVKDLPDIALLATSGPLDAAKVRSAIEQTFNHRATHAIPQMMPDPASGWKPVYERIARADDLDWKTIEELVDVVRRFIDPLLGGVAGTWNPRSWTWKY